MLKATFQIMTFLGIFLFTRVMRNLTMIAVTQAKHIFSSHWNHTLLSKTPSPWHRLSIHIIITKRCFLWDSPGYTGWPIKNGTVDTVDFSGLCSDQQLSFFTLLDHGASFPHYNNTKIIKFGWELFILWVISHGLSFSGFARFPEFRGMINDTLMANPENDSQYEITHKIKSSQPNFMILVLL